MESSPQESVDAKAEFRKPSGDASNRKYRRRSPLNISSPSSDDSPSRARSSSPLSRRDSAKISGDRHSKDEGRDLDRDSGRSCYGRSGESYQPSDRQSSRSSHSYHCRDDYGRRDKYADDNDRDDSKLSYRFGRESRGNTYSDHPKRDDEHRSRDSPLEFEKYSWDKCDDSGHGSKDKERDALYTDYKKYGVKDSSTDRAASGRRHSSLNTEDVRYGDRDRCKEVRDSRDYKTDRRRGFGDDRNNHDESRDYQNDLTSRREGYGRRLYESSRGNTKEFNAEKHTKEGKKKYDDRDRYKERNYVESREKVEDRKSPQSKGRDSPPKRPKVFSMDASRGHGNDASAAEKQPLDSKQAPESVDKITSEQAYVTDADIDAAKIAAMKAAELVNRNLVGTGFMSTEQKKKLLWGNKKNTTNEESAHRWDTTLFGDRERQEKFNKLMSLRLAWYLWPIVGCEGRHESGAQGRDGRCREREDSAGLGEAVHCWASTKRWSHSRAGSLRMYKECCCSSSIITVGFAKLLYFCASYVFVMLLHCFRGICGLVFKLWDHDGKRFCLCVFDFHRGSVRVMVVVGKKLMGCFRRNNVMEVDGRVGLGLGLGYAYIPCAAPSSERGVCVFVCEAEEQLEKILASYYITVMTLVSKGLNNVVQVMSVELPHCVAP